MTSIMSKIARIATSHRGVTSVMNQNFDYFLVLDFEATCDRSGKIVQQEIIEFPVLKFNCRTLNVESQFHQYVQPVVHKQLTPFCIELTGIVQDMVEGQPNLEETLEKFDEWMKKELLDPGARFSFVTCGDWDLKTMLPGQCQHFKITPRPYFNRWINIKKAFADVTGIFPKGLLPMLQELKIQHVGRHHSGIDDCRNIAAILKSLLDKGYVFSTTGTLGH